MKFRMYYIKKWSQYMKIIRHYKSLFTRGNVYIGFKVWLHVYFPAYQSSFWAEVCLKSKWKQFASLGAYNSSLEMIPVDKEDTNCFDSLTFLARVILSIYHSLTDIHMINTLYVIIIINYYTCFPASVIIPIMDYFNWNLYYWLVTSIYALWPPINNSSYIKQNTSNIF